MEEMREADGENRADRCPGAGRRREELPEELRAHRIVYLEKPETVNTLTHNEDVTVNARSKDKDALKTVEEMLRDETFRIKTIEEE